MDFEFVYIFEWAARLVMGPVIVLRRGSPSTALAWLVVVFLLPFFGTFAYFLVGESRLGRKSSSRYREVVEKLSVVLGKTISESHMVGSELRPTHQLISDLVSGLGGSPTLGSNQLVLIQDVEDLVEKLVGDIDAAKDHCHLLYYIFHDDSVGRRVAKALISAAGRGVPTRLLVDAVGSKRIVKRPIWDQMRRAGVQVCVALPVNPVRAIFARLDLRNHRKVAVIDGRIAYVGSHNISEALYPKKERFGAWVDASVRVTGPIVQFLQELFLQDWCTSGGDIEFHPGLFPPVGATPSRQIALQILPTGPEKKDVPLEKVILQAIHVARRRVVLTTPYFVPDDALVDAMEAASFRGVEVDLVVPRTSDAPVVQAAGRSRYGDLLEAGIHVHEFTEGLLHAKTITVDGEVAVIGTANLDLRSFFLNFEVAVLVYDEEFAARVHFLQRHYIARSTPVTHAAWKERGPGRVLVDNIAKLMSPLL